MKIFQHSAALDQWERSNVGARPMSLHTGPTQFVAANPEPPDVRDWPRTRQVVDELIFSLRINWSQVSLQYKAC